MALIIKTDPTAENATMELKAGEPLVFSLQLRSTAGIVNPLTNDEFVLSIYKPGTRTEIDYFNAVKTTDDRGDIALWALTGTHSEDWYTKMPLRFDVVRRNDDGRDTILQGNITIKESAPRIDDLNNAPIARYINKIVRSNDPETIATPNFAVTMAAYVPAGSPTIPSVTPTPTPTPTPATGGVLSAAFNDPNSILTYTFI